MIKIKNLKKSYGNKRILNDISLNAGKGEVIAVLGKNGAGKTTLFKVLLGLTKKSEGEIAVLGQPDYTDSLRKEIGFCMSIPVFYEHLNAIENMSIECEYYKLDKSNICSVLRAVGLDPYNNEPVKKYSFGMRQRLQFAECCIKNPPIIIMDEPFNGLDPKGIVKLKNTIRNMANGEKTILISSHILSEIKQAATRIIVIAKGTIVLDRYVNELVEEHTKDFEAFLIKKMEGYDETQTYRFD